MPCRSLSRTIGVVVTEPDPQERQHELLSVGLPAGEAGEHPLELLESGQVRIGRDGRHGPGRGVDHALHDGRQQGHLGIEVVVEAALGRPELDQDVLDAHLLVTLHLDQALGDVDERVSPEGVGRWVERARHCLSR